MIQILTLSLGTDLLHTKKRLTRRNVYHRIIHIILLIKTGMLSSGRWSKQECPENNLHLASDVTNFRSQGYVRLVLEPN